MAFKGFQIPTLLTNIYFISYVDTGKRAAKVTIVEGSKLCYFDENLSRMYIMSAGDRGNRQYDFTECSDGTMELNDAFDD